MVERVAKRAAWAAVRVAREQLVGAAAVDAVAAAVETKAASAEARVAASVGGSVEAWVAPKEEA